jgi:Zn-dependent protease/CBS domain-containing protein
VPGRGITLFELLGFKVRVDFSWIFLALLVTWSLARGLFPAYYPELAPATYYWMAIAGAIGLFFSIILHELSHSLVARRYGLQIKGITLFIFGGVAEMEDEPRDPKSEFLMAIAGPIASFALALGFHLIATVLEALGTGVPPVGVTRYLALINLLLAAFNLVPAFPLDGGRAFRAALWYWKGDLRWSTRRAVGISHGFAFFLMALGVLNVVYGNFIGGMWWFLIGLFLRSAAQGTYMQLVTRRAFEGETVSRFMTPNPVTVPPGLTLLELVEDYIYRLHYDLFPVVEDRRLIGCITARDLKSVPRDDWPHRRVRQVMHPCGRENTIGPEADPVQALSRMRRHDASRLLVMSDGRLLGIVALKDLLGFLALKMDLEDLD